MTTDLLVQSPVKTGKKRPRISQENARGCIPRRPRKWEMIELSPGIKGESAAGSGTLSHHASRMNTSDKPSTCGHRASPFIQRPTLQTHISGVDQFTNKKQTAHPRRVEESVLGIYTHTRRAESLTHFLGSRSALSAATSTSKPEHPSTCKQKQSLGTTQLASSSVERTQGTQLDWCVLLHRSTRGTRHCGRDLT